MSVRVKSQVSSVNMSKRRKLERPTHVLSCLTIVAAMATSQLAHAEHANADGAADCDVEALLAMMQADVLARVAASIGMAVELLQTDEATRRVLLGGGSISRRNDLDAAQLVSHAALAQRASLLEAEAAAEAAAVAAAAATTPEENLR